MVQKYFLKNVEVYSDVYSEESGIVNGAIGLEDVDPLSKSNFNTLVKFQGASFPGHEIPSCLMLHFHSTYSFLR